MICRDCKKEFIISRKEEMFFLSKGLELPKRCPQCRKLRREKSEQEKVKRDEAQLTELLKTTKYKKIEINQIELSMPNKTLVVIGNGFDIAHKVPSSFWDFQKTIGKNNELRRLIEQYLDVRNKKILWSNLEESLGKLKYAQFLNSDVLDMFLDSFDAYDEDAQVADMFVAIESTVLPAINIPAELTSRFTKWIRTLKVETDKRPFSFLQGDYKVLSFNYTEFIEDLYGAKDICYIHGCRKIRKGYKPDELILGHTPRSEEKQWDNVKIKPKYFKNRHKQEVFDAAIETSIRYCQEYDENTTKHSKKIIKDNTEFFERLTNIDEIYVLGHSLSLVDFDYFKEIKKRCPHSSWVITIHSLSDYYRFNKLVQLLKIDEVALVRI